MFDVNPIALKFHHADLERAVKNARNPREYRRNKYNSAIAVGIVALIALIVILPSLHPSVGA